jgi:TrmH family RNA methyltransferase
MLTSVRNPKVQRLRALQSRAKRRREAGSFVVEGVRLAEEALAAGWELRLGLYTEGLSARGQTLVEQLRAQDVDLELVSPEVMAAASDTQTPQGILLELAQRELPLAEQPDLLLVADQLRDPGNLGTLLRSAAAAGADGALLAPGCADAWAPKVLRTGMGAHFALPIHSLDWNAVRDLCSQHSLQVYYAEAGQGLSYDAADLTRPLALILGGEADGPGPEARALAKSAIHIPMPGRAESLNAATAGSLLLFEAARQRRAKEGPS